MSRLELNPVCLQVVMEDLAKMGHDIEMFDPYFGVGYSGGRIQAISVDPESSIVTANHDRRKSGSVDGF